MSFFPKSVTWPKLPIDSGACAPRNASSKSSESRTLLIDFLRGFAALSVALFHFNEGHPTLGDLYHLTIKHGWLGVPVFFVISGYCIAAAANRERSNVTSFWLQRLVRIFPPYWGSVAIVLTLIGIRVAFFGVNDIAILPKTATEWLYCLAALNSPASPYSGLNWVYWSLAYEIAFYMAMGLAFLRFSAVWLCSLSLLAFWIDVYPFDQWALFGLGVGCYYLLWKLSWSACALFAICSLGIFSENTHDIATVGFVTAIALLYPPPLKWIASLSRLRYLGEISYSLYLVHVPVGCYLVQQALGDLLRRDTLLTSLVRDFTLLVLSMAVATALYRIVERPSHQLARSTRVGKV